MNERGFMILYRFRYLFCSLLLVVSLLVLSLLLSVIGNNQVQARTTASASINTGDSSNVVSDGFDSVINGASGATTAALSAVHGVNNAVIQVSGAALGATVDSGKFVARNTYGAAVFAAHTPVYAWHGIASVAHIGSFIKPSENDKTKVPQIDPTIAMEIAGSKPAANAYSVAAQEDTTTQWPIKGYITEEFGVPHWPYQPIHTGIDISDGAAPGVTPIRPFKPGRVIVVVHSSAGFGNHVIIDHGGGLTSLYGHMYSTAVQVGQLVDKNTILGYEGSTGVSTGVHVHFELEVDNRPVNPHLYVAGNPN